MPIKSTIVPGDRLVLTRSWNIVTFEGTVAHYSSLLADPQFAPEFDQLALHADSVSFAGTTQQLAAIARRKIFSNTSFRAHVAGTDSVYGLLRLATTYHEIEHKHDFAQVFRDEKSAREWLSEMRARRDAMGSGSVGLQQVHIEAFLSGI